MCCRSCPLPDLTVVHWTDPQSHLQRVEHSRVVVTEAMKLNKHAESTSWTYCERLQVVW